jgi:hypothetical protein
MKTRNLFLGIVAALSCAIALSQVGINGEELFVGDLTISGTCTGCGGGGGHDPSTELYFFDDFLSFTGMSAGVISAVSPGDFYAVTINGGSPSVEISTDTGHPGVARLRTGACTDCGPSLILGNGITSNPQNPSMTPSATNAITVDCVVRVPTLPDGTNTFTSSCGISSRHHTSTGVNNAVLGQAVWNGSAVVWNLQFESSDSITNIPAVTGPSANTWHHMRIIATTAAASLEIDGVEVASGTTGIPTAGMGAVAWTLKSAGTTDREFQIDLYQVSQPLTARLN